MYPGIDGIFTSGTWYFLLALMICIPDHFISELVSMKKSSLSLVSIMVSPVVGGVVMSVA